MRYIKSFTNDTAIQAAVDSQALGKPYVALNDATGKIDWNGKEDYSKIHLTIEALEDGDFVVRKNCQYSLNNGDWTNISSNETISLSTGDKVRFKGNLTKTGKIFGGESILFNVYGNAMSLISGDSFSEAVSIPEYAFEMCFDDAYHLKGKGPVDASNLVLPVMTLSNYCYNAMFNYCVNLTSAPKLPATGLSLGCYRMMFSNCTSLTTAPALPATTLADNCYESMFNNCTSLITAPELPASILSNLCYFKMFYRCRSLNYTKCLSTVLSANRCLEFWLQEVSNTGTFVKAAGVEWPRGTSGIPSGWTVIEE